jgi:hypothetical protein
MVRRMIAISCPDCGKPVLWHLRHEHRCQKSKPKLEGLWDDVKRERYAELEPKPQKSKPAKNPTTKPVAKTVPSKSISPSSRRIITPPEPVTTPARNYGSEEEQREAEVRRVTEWRKKPENRAKYNAYQRKRRAAQKALKS